MSILIPEKVRVLNKPSQAPITFLDAAGVATTAAAAVTMDIEGYGKTKIADVTKVSIQRGTQPVKSEAEVTITSASGIPANTSVYLEVIVETTNREFRLARPDYEFGQKLRYKVTGDGTITDATTLAAAFEASIESNLYRNRKLLVSASAAAGVLTLTAETEDGYSISQRGLYFESIKLVSETGGISTDASIVPVITAGTEGIGYGSDIEFKEKLQGKNNTPYFFDREEIPYETSLYTEISWEFSISRPDPKAHDLSPKTRHVLYLEETAMDAVIDDVADFFLTGIRATSLEDTGLKVGFNDAEAFTNTAAASDETTGQVDSDVATIVPIVGALAGTDPKYVVIEQVGTIDAVTTTLMLTRFKENA